MPVKNYFLVGIHWVKNMVRRQLEFRAHSVRWYWAEGANYYLCAGDQRGWRWERAGLGHHGADGGGAYPAHAQAPCRPLALPVLASIWLWLQPLLLWKRPTLPDRAGWVFLCWASQSFLSSPPPLWSHELQVLMSVHCIPLRTYHLVVVHGWDILDEAVFFSVNQCERLIAQYGPCLKRSSKGYRMCLL